MILCFGKGGIDFFHQGRRFFNSGPDDVHMPSIQINGPSKVKKVVVKVLI